MRRSGGHDKTRQRIIDAATKQFLERGYGNTSTRDIAKVCKITQPALYHHFSDKEVLYMDSMTYLAGNVRQDVNSVMRAEDLDPETRLFRIAKVLMKYHPRSVYDQFNDAQALLSQSSQRKLEILFRMDYIEPVAEFFKLPGINLRADILPNEAAELFIDELAPIFGTVQDIGGHNLTTDDRIKLLVDCIVMGLAAR